MLIQLVCPACGNRAATRAIVNGERFLTCGDCGSETCDREDIRFNHIQRSILRNGGIPPPRSSGDDACENTLT